MSGPTVRWLALTPTASNLEAALREWEAPGGWIASLDGQWLPSAPGRDGHEERLDLTGLLGQILGETKARVLPIADDALIQAIVASACEEFSADSRLAASAQFPGFHRRAVRVLRDLDGARLEPDGLRELAAQLPDYLSEKLESLALLKERVVEKLSGLALDTAEGRLEKVLSYATLPALPDVWLWVGSDYRPSFAALIRKIAWSAKSLTVVVESLPGRPQLTAGAHRYATIFEVLPKIQGSANGLATHLFQESRPENLDLRVQIASASDPLAEAEWAVRMALEEISAEEKSPGAVAIYARQMGNYRPLLAASANRLKLPIALSQQTGLVDAGIIAYLLELLKAARPGREADLLTASKSTYSGLSAKDRAELKELVKLPDWEGAAPTETKAGKWLRWALDIGKEIFQPNPSPTDQLLRFVLSVLGDEAIVSPAKAQEATKERDVTVLNAASEALKRELQIRALEGETGLFADSMTGEEFLDFLERLWASSTVHIPASGPGVRMAQDSASLGECQTLIVLGMLEGIFPRRRSEDPILSDFERSQINALLPDEQRLEDSHAAARREREEFLRLCSVPTQRVVFLYPQTDEEKDNVPAFYLEEIRRVAGPRLTQTDFSRNLLTPPGEECISVADQQLQQALLGMRELPQPPSLSNAQAIEKVVSLPEKGYDLYELRDALTCSFQYAFRRQLHVATPDEDAGASLGHLPQEAGLMLAENEAEARQRIEIALESEVLRLGNRFGSEQIRLIEAAGRRLIPEWVAREFRAREIWPKQPGSLVTSVPFGDPMLPDTLPIRGQTVKLKGNVGGIARFGDYRIAIRYGARRGLIVDKLENLETPYRLELGVLLLSLTAGGHPFVGAEIDGASGGRVLYLCPRPEDMNIGNDLSMGLRVIPIEDRKGFFEEVKELLARALDGMKQGSVMPCAGDHCKVCSFGELCRSSQLFGEQIVLGDEELFADE